ncbi:M13-type metalloendopeptidase [Coralloluteibacterium stylophorae]|uniref:M13-type metalloendopeptidase n=1 Tax=Coralloluteibacterium stylophorae TaxID=1776034 RepID=UPI0036068A05
MRLDPAELDPGRDPARDLDAHVNARWREATVRPADRAAWDSFSILQAHTEQVLAGLAQAASEDRDAVGAARAVGRVWRAGLDLDARERAGLAPLRPRLEAIAALRTPDEVAAFIDDAHAAGEDLLWRPAVAPDPEAPARPLLGLHPARLTLPDRDDLLDPARRGQRRRRLARAHLRGLLLRAGLCRDQARAQAAAALDLDAALAAALPSPRERDVAAFHQPLSWTDAARRLAPWRLAPCLAAAGVAPPARLSLAVPGFHARAAGLLRERPVEAWRAWLRARLLDLHARHLDADLRARYQRFHGRALRGRARPPEWRQVLEDLDLDLGDALSELYVARAVDGGLRPRMQAVFDGLRTAFLARIDAARWLGERGRRHARAKIAGMRAALVAPECWPDWHGFDTGNDGYAGLLAEARRRARTRLLQRLAAGVGAAWDMPAHRVNARYDPARNRIVVPAALLQPPFLDGVDPAALYGGIGAVMAHEMTHALDDQGRRFDAAGRLAEDAWDASDRAAFDARLAALRAAFEGRGLGDGLRLDGALIAGELVADFGGLAIAHDALRAVLRAGGAGDAERAAADRRFFIAWAVLWRQCLSVEERRLRASVDPHPPAALRADAPARALPAFAAAFGGDAGTGAGLGVW